ncbi:MAG: PspC domain-containing protein [Candidatus Heimdallarchaeota archaeon]
MKTEANEEEVRLLFRSKSDYLFAGVLGGLGYYWNIDSTIIRILFLFLTILTIGLTVIIYFILIKAIPLEPEV